MNVEPQGRAVMQLCKHYPTSQAADSILLVTNAYTRFRPNYTVSVTDHMHCTMGRRCQHRATWEFCIMVSQQASQRVRTQQPHLLCGVTAGAFLSLAGII